MGEPWAIVVLPTKAGGALVGYGPCGARSPSVVHYPSRGADSPWQPYHGILPSPAGVVGLPLWWDGALVPEGWDRARRVADPLLRLARVSCPFSDEVLKLARALLRDVVLS